jgi:hypothetical protein
MPSGIRAPELKNPRRSPETDSENVAQGLSNFAATSSSGFRGNKTSTAAGNSSKEYSKPKSLRYRLHSAVMKSDAGSPSLTAECLLTRNCWPC